MEVKLRLKYRQGWLAKRGKYRARTGPKCCNAGCGSTRKKKNKKVARQVITAGALRGASAAKTA